MHVERAPVDESLAARATLKLLGEVMLGRQVADKPNPRADTLAADRAVVGELAAVHHPLVILQGCIVLEPHPALAAPHPTSRPPQGGGPQKGVAAQEGVRAAGAERGEGQRGVVCNGSKGREIAVVLQEI